LDAILSQRYQWELAGQSAEDYLASLAEQRYQQDQERAARQLLNDFRKGLMGPLPLELPPESAEG
jgi:ribosome biogenesis GTPase A